METWLMDLTRGNWLLRSRSLESYHRKLNILVAIALLHYWIWKKSTQQLLAIGNWAIDTFGEVYSSKLPLPAMRVLAGGETRKGYYRNARVTFKGDPEHLALANNFFPWVESAEKTLKDGENPTARAFLNLLKNLRWVILQDAAVLKGKYNRHHFIFTNQRDVFESSLFLDFQRRSCD